jgi:hypothetical protein
MGIWVNLLVSSLPLSSFEDWSSIEDSFSLPT